MVEYTQWEKMAVAQKPQWEKNGSSPKTQARKRQTAGKKLACRLMLGVGGWEKQSGLAGTALLTPDGTSGGSSNKWLLAP